MPSNRLNNFDKFYNENKDKLYMPLNKNYPLNYKKGIHWSNLQCDEESKSFALSIIENTRYVSFYEFNEELKKISLSYLKNIKKDKDFVYILIIPYKIKKSNTWVSLLVYKYLKPIINYIEYDINDVYNRNIDSKDILYKKKIRCILCDDCSYTGLQIMETLSFNNKLNIKNDKKEPEETDKEWLQWNNNLKKKINNVISNIDINYFSVDVIIPYISSRANKLINKLQYVRIPSSRNIFDTFIEQININLYPQYIINEFYSTFMYHDDISAIYFDHKIADAVSTFNKVYLLAPLFNCSNRQIKYNFIENCDLSYENIDNNVKFIDLEKEMEVCPSTFYKKIKYTYKNKQIDTDLELKAILE
jgi:hypothetical protein